MLKAKIPLLTDQEAADLLNVSQPYLANLLASGAIPCYEQGTRRGVCYQDVLDYKKQMQEQQITILKDLTEEAQKLDIGY
ncbi:MAG: helix-turn-helix domain-containing protein [Magnetococcales bacterium]|nr:helix-turn-helix domain-containing protein [Magnetococcales bacterium]